MIIKISKIQDILVRFDLHVLYIREDKYHDIGPLSLHPNLNKCPVTYGQDCTSGDRRSVFSYYLVKDNRYSFRSDFDSNHSSCIRLHPRIVAQVYLYYSIRNAIIIYYAKLLD